MMTVELKSLEEVRNKIDEIDSKIIKLISERANFVKQAAKFKKNQDAVRAPKRVEEVIEKVRNLAVKENLDPNIAEDVYRTMINCFINYELNEYSKSTK
ncbi:chorismate mutase [Aeribacillus sp. FSL K6-2848]|jgi:isochorismate pyruvate lyase|uniref:chorismate mutase n=1 Tax=Aeribacillus sp. FSL K6-2848 TaxID=2954612 RepID=UPI0030F9A1FB